MVSQAEIILNGYHSSVPGLISICLEMVWVPLMNAEAQGCGVSLIRTGHWTIDVYPEAAATPTVLPWNKEILANFRNIFHCFLLRMGDLLGLIRACYTERSLCQNSTLCTDKTTIQSQQNLAEQKELYNQLSLGCLNIKLVNNRPTLTLMFEKMHFEMLFPL